MCKHDFGDQVATITKHRAVGMTTLQSEPIRWTRTCKLCGKVEKAKKEA